MKLILCSEGFSTPNTVQACVDLCGKPQDQIRVAIINEAYAVEQGDKYWVLKNLNDAANNFTGGVDLINLLALPPGEVEARIAACDVIFVVGGNTDYLMHVFNKTGFAALLPKLLKTKVYVGSSAGSMVAGKRLSTDAHKIMYGEEDDYGVDTFLELVDVAIMPHLNSAHFPSRKETLCEAAKNYPGIVYGLQDDSAIVVDGGELKVIGSEVVKVVNGKIEDEKSESLSCDIVLLPNSALAQKAIATSQQLQQFNALYELQQDVYVPHASLYMTRIKLSDLDKVKELLANTAGNTLLIDLISSHYKQSEGYIDAEYSRNKMLDDLQMVVVNAINPIRDGLREEDTVRLPTLTGKVRENVEKYGYRGVGELFRPHLTFTRFANEKSIDLAALPEAGEFSGQFVKLGLFELGDHGTCVRKIAVFNLGEKL